MVHGAASAGSFKKVGSLLGNYLSPTFRPSGIELGARIHVIRTHWDFINSMEHLASSWFNSPGGPIDFDLAGIDITRDLPPRPLLGGDWHE